MKDDRITLKEKFGYALTAMGSDMTTQFTGSFLQLFYTSVVGIPIALASLVISLSVIWDAINDPLIASWVDNHRFKNGERMRPVLLFSSLPFALCFIMIFTVDASVTAKTVYSFVWYFIYMVPRTFYYLPVFTLRQVATPDLEERLSLNAWVSYGQAFGSSLPTLIMWPIMYAAAGTIYVNGARQMENPEKGYLVAAVIIAVTVFACSLFNYFTTKERVKSENPEKIGVVAAMKILLKDSNFVYNLVLFFFYGLVVTLCTGYAAYFTNYVLNDSSLLTPISACFIVGTLLATPFVKKLYNSLGRNRSMRLGSAILALGALVFTALSMGRFYTASEAYLKISLIAPFFFTFCVGVGTAITIIVISINRADVADVIEWKGGKRMDGMVSNVTGFIKKLAHALVTLLLGVLLQIFGFIESTAEVKYPEQPESAQIAIVLIMGLGVLVSAVLMIAFSSKVTLDSEIELHNEAEKEKTNES